MKCFRLYAMLAVLFLALAACQSTVPVVGDGDAEGAESDTSRVYTNQVHVLVDGRDVGTVPRTVRVRRSFGTRAVSLYQAGEEIRVYELPIQPTSSGQQTRMGFWGTRSPEGETYDVRNLPHEDEVYEVPFSAQPMKIEDHEYGVTLLIRE
ncbi:MAG: hypothetical protein WD021_02220 [Rhodothermales bacterium]